MNATGWLERVGPCTVEDWANLARLRTQAQAIGCTIRWSWVGGKWTGKRGWRFGHAEIVRQGEVVDYVGVVWCPGETSGSHSVSRLLDDLEKALKAQSES